ncbi:MAG TPA: methyltransferase [Myxococcota bacterium]|nr:methyltransferase [Myxococcota bacterium]
MSESKPAAPPAIPPGVALYYLGIGHYVSHALYLAAKLGLADLLRGGPRSAAELAADTDTHAPSLRRVLRLLASAGLFAESDDGRFALTQSGELLRSDVPGSMKASVQLFAGPAMFDGWRELEFCVRTGLPALQKHHPGANGFDEMAKDPERAANFDKAMATFAPATSAAVAAAYDFSGIAKLADVGGGNGAILCGILRAYPKLRGLVFDQPHVIARAKAHVAEQGLADRCETLGGSFFEKVPAGADAVLLKHVIHDWDDERATTILRNVRAALPAHGKLLIVEGVYPPRVDQSLESRGAASNDVNMLVSTGGRQRDEGEFRSLYAAAGFRLTRIVPTPARVAVIEGVPV